MSSKETHIYVQSLKITVNICQLLILLSNVSPAATLYICNTNFIAATEYKTRLCIFVGQRLSSTIQTFFHGGNVRRLSLFLGKIFRRATVLISTSSRLLQTTTSHVDIGEPFPLPPSTINKKKKFNSDRFFPKRANRYNPIRLMQK